MCVRITHRTPRRPWVLLWPCLLCLSLGQHRPSKRVIGQISALLGCSHSQKALAWAHLEPVAAHQHTGGVGRWKGRVDVWDFRCSHNNVNDNDDVPPVM